jgi:NADP-dependent 3-hydroxy acid dehydrogenase YdfG
MGEGVSKLVVITGAGTGFGRAVPRRLCGAEHRAILLGRTAAKAGLERFTEAMRAELEPGIKVTLLRAGQMTDEDMAWTVDPAITRRFAEENLKRGIDSRARPISAFDSVALLVESLIALPYDVQVPLIQAEGAR